MARVKATGLANGLAPTVQANGQAAARATDRVPGLASEALENVLAAASATFPEAPAT